MNTQQNEYADIISLAHYQSTKRKHMSLHDRAAQFAPFAALRGFDEEISETARQTDSRLELDDERMADLNEKIHLIIDNIKSMPEVEITCFVPDSRKSGGEYVTVKGRVRRVDEVLQFLQFTDRRTVSLPDILHICLKGIK